MYLSPMSTSTSSDFPAYIVCHNCGHEHQAIDVEDIVIIDADGVRPVNDADEIKPGATVVCADEEACERRMARWPQPDDEIDWSDPPEDAAPAHLDGNPDEGHMYPDDGDGYYDTDGWDD